MSDADGATAVRAAAGEALGRLGPAAIPLDIDTLDLIDGPATVERMTAIQPEATRLTMPPAVMTDSISAPRATP